MKYVINPLRGVNDIEFGMKANDVQNRMSGNFESYVSGENMEEFKDSFPTDYYKNEGVLCFYDTAGRLEGMQFYEPSRPTLGIVNLLSLSVAQATSLLRQIDPDIAYHEGDGIVSRRFNIAIRSPDMDEDDKVLVDNVVVAAPGYYDYLDEY